MPRFLPYVQFDSTVAPTVWDGQIRNLVYDSGSLSWVPQTSATGGGDASAANQTTEITRLTSIRDQQTDGTQKVQVTSLPATPAGSNVIGHVIVDSAPSTAVTGPLTDTQLRASAVPVSAAALPLPSGASTAARQDTGNTSLSSIDGKLATLGQKAMTGSLPVVLPTDQTPPTDKLQTSTLTGNQTVTFSVAGYNTVAIQILADGGFASGTIDFSQTSATSPAAGDWTVFPVVQDVGTNDYETWTQVFSAGLWRGNVAGVSQVRLVSSSVSTIATINFRASPAKLNYSQVTDSPYVVGSVHNTDNVAQASTTSGQVGPLILGATTTNAPVYTTAKTNPLSTDTAGNLRVSLKDSTMPTLAAGTALIGKVGIDQTTPGTTNGVQVNAALPTGTNSIGQVTSNAGTNTSTANLDVALSTRLKAADTLTGVTTVGAVTSITNALPAGSNLLGKTGIDQTTPGTTNKVYIGTDGTVQANAGTNLNTSALALEATQLTGNVSAASIDTKMSTLLTQTDGIETTLSAIQSQQLLPVTVGQKSYVDGDTKLPLLDTNGNLRTVVTADQRILDLLGSLVSEMRAIKLVLCQTAGVSDADFDQNNFLG